MFLSKILQGLEMIFGTKDVINKYALKCNRLFPVTVHFCPCNLSHLDSQTSLWSGPLCSTLAASQPLAGVHATSAT